MSAVNQFMCNGDFIFVYGTLRQACSTGAHHIYLTGAEFIGSATVNGTLLRVSYYPALVFDNSGGKVIGEVYKLQSAEQLARLDEYEECDYPAQPDQEYQRQKINLITDSGIALSAWVYAYQQTSQSLQIIASGDFLNP